MSDRLQNAIIYRKMGMKDIEGVLSVENLSFSLPWSGEMFLEEMKNPCAVYFVAETNGRIAAYAGLWVILDEGHITNIAVDPSYRGRKIASGLMRTMFDFAVEKGLRGLTLEVREGNSPAIALYERFGFMVEGRRKAYYSDTQEDAYIMWRYLE